MKKSRDGFIDIVCHSCVLAVVILGMIVIIGCSGGGDNGGGDNDGNGSNGTSGSGLDYITSIENVQISTGYYETIDVASDGSIYLLSNETGIVGDPKLIYVYDSNNEYVGTLKEEETYGGDDITGDDIILDDFDRLHVYNNNWGNMVHDIYEIDGHLVSSFSGSISSFLFAMAQDVVQNNYMIPFSGSGTGGEPDIYLKIVNHDFTEIIDELDKNEILPMLPGAPAATEVTMNDVRVSANDLVLICIDLQDANDGILILDEELNKAGFLGGNWILNAPRAVDADSQGNLYVSSTYGYAVLVFDNELNQIGAIDQSDFPNGLLQNEFMPADIRVKDGKLYILDTRNDCIHIFSTIDYMNPA